MKKTLISLIILSSSLSFGLSFDELNEKARSGDSDAQFKMGLVYEFGKAGIPQNKWDAEIWYKKSGSDKALSRLAVLSYEDGNMKLAKKYLKKPLENTFPFAFLYMGKILIAEGEDKDNSYKYIQFAATKGVPQAMHEFALYQKEKGEDYVAYVFMKSASIKGYKASRSLANEYQKALNPKETISANNRVRSLVK